MIIPSNKIIIFSAPSGSGKTTITKEVIKKLPLLSLSVSATNRDKRAGEEDGVDYHFLSTEQFKEKVVSGDFIEWEEVYPGRFYGTLKYEIERLVKKNKIPVFDIEFKGATNLKKMYGDNALIIFIKVPIDTIKDRLIARGTETEATLQARIDRFKQEMTYEREADIVVENIYLEKAIDESVNIINDFLKN